MSALRLISPDYWARRAILSRLRDIGDGAVVVDEGGVRRAFGSPRPGCAVPTIQVRDPQAWTEIALGGTLGAGEAFVDGLWSTDDLPELVRLLVRNRGVLERLEAPYARLRAPLVRVAHAVRSGTRASSRRNVRRHYDLGNEFFELLLDPTMMYSCAVFEDPSNPREPLESASRRKLDLVCRKLGLAPGDRVLEIGTGWGGFAVHAAANYGARVVTTTISDAQHRFASERIRLAGLADRAQVLRLDYRELPGALGERFDKLVSIEMVEAVGHRFLGTYGRVCGKLLAPGGTALIQAITIAEPLYDAYRRSVDFIQRHVFPGGALPSLGALRRALEGPGGLQVEQVHDITEHYITTLRRWRANFQVNRARIRDLGFSDGFCRMWEFYLGYCEGGFAERSIHDYQIVLRKPTAGRAVIS